MWAGRSDNSLTDYRKALIMRLLSPPLLLLLCFLLVFMPTLNHWLYESGNAWYRLHLLWLAVIVFVFINQHRSRKRDV